MPKTEKIESKKIEISKQTETELDLLCPHDKQSHRKILSSERSQSQSRYIDSEIYVSADADSEKHENNNSKNQSSEKDLSSDLVIDKSRI